MSRRLLVFKGVAQRDGSKTGPGRWGQLGHQRKEKGTFLGSHMANWYIDDAIAEALGLS